MAARPWTRAEGRVFYLRMLKRASFDPPAPTSQQYVDVPLESWYAEWVRAAEGAGLIEPHAATPEQRSCPEDPLMQEIAAHIMVKAENLALP